MARRINTDLGINVSLTDAPDVKTVSITNPPKIEGKNNFELLADVLGQFNPKIQELAKKDLEREAQADLILGANQVNSMTLEEARKAHQQGFPDIYNGWARVGAYKQYANNANEEFANNFKKRYLENRNTAGYNWQNDYAEISALYIQDKKQDPFFQAAYQKTNESTQKWIQEKEFEFQSKELIDRVSTDLAYQFKTLPDKVVDILDAEFRDTIPIETSGKDFLQRKQEFIQNNLEKRFNEEYEKIKTNLNPALTKVQFDDIFLTQAQAHATMGGNYAPFYIKKIIEPKSDGTPAIIDNPKFTEKAISVVSKLNESIKVQQFYQNLKTNNTSTISDEDYKKYSTQLFDNLVNQYQANGATQGQAIQEATKVLLPSLGTNRPIPQIKQILNRPIGTVVTNDNRAALNLALMLDSAGALPAYFDGSENNKDAIKWNMAVMFYRNGENINSIIPKMGRLEQSAKISPLTDAEKNTLGSTFKNLQTVYNQELVYGVAQYFKSTNASGANLDKLTEQYIDTYFFKDKGGKYISRSKLKSLGIGENDYDDFKKEAINAVKDSLPKPVITEDKSVGKFGTNKLLKEYYKNNPEKIPDTSFNADNYDFIIKPDNRTAYFILIVGTNYFQPVMMTTKTGEERILMFDLGSLQDKFIKTRQAADNKKLRLAQEKDKAIKEFINFSNPNELQQQLRKTGF
jgi:translation initiation factor 2 beta subunit (eIF-2beta)/eIF-5